jgi:RNA polymerase-associated protein CTR9
VHYHVSAVLIGIQAHKLQPTDKSITYNIAMLEQKAAEMLFSIAPGKRNLADLQQAIEQAGHAQT